MTRSHASGMWWSCGELFKHGYGEGCRDEKKHMKLYTERCGEGSAERTCERKMGVGEKEKWKVWTSGKVMEAGEKEKWKGDGMEE